MENIFRVLFLFMVSIFMQEEFFRDAITSQDEIVLPPCTAFKGVEDSLWVAWRAETRLTEISRVVEQIMVFNPLFSLPGSPSGSKVALPNTCLKRSPSP